MLAASAAVQVILSIVERNLTRLTVVVALIFSVNSVALFYLLD